MQFNKQGFWQGPRVLTGSKTIQQKCHCLGQAKKLEERYKFIESFSMKALIVLTEGFLGLVAVAPLLLSTDREYLRRSNIEYSDWTELKKATPTDQLWGQTKNWKLIKETMCKSIKEWRTVKPTEQYNNDKDTSHIAHFSHHDWTTWLHYDRWWRHRVRQSELITT